MWVAKTVLRDSALGVVHMDNVINLFSRNKIKTQATQLEVKQIEQVQELPKSDFQTVAERNAAVQERLRRERQEANKNVLKSYRIK